MFGPVRPLFARPDFQAVAGRTLRPGGTALTARLLDRLAPHARDWALDVGCARGATLDLFQDRGLRGVGVDISTGMLAQVDSGLPAAGSVLDLPLKPGIFSVVLCECVLSLVEDKPRALAETARVLKPGGLLGLADLYLRPGKSAGVLRAVRTDADKRERDVFRAPPTEPKPSFARAGVPAGCPSGALSRPALESLLHEAGFTLHLFEDHSRALAELAAELLFSGFARETLGLCSPGAGRAGYFTCVARKEIP